MDVFDFGFEHARSAWTTIPLLVLAMACLIGWFPGHNARLRRHIHASFVRAGGWTLMLGLVIGLLGGVSCAILAPTFLAAWIGLTVWSYGQLDQILRVNHRTAFEV